MDVKDLRRKENLIKKLRIKNFNVSLEAECSSLVAGGLETLHIKVISRRA